ncbi:hypothetical protein ACFQZ1_23125 [Bacillus sp. CGMCC 1.60114]|uniref:hypothetical protein n=1 Tax=unclassified Bacillus (in: firmicutes) TaxID=185979 RepID=UPI003644350F
MTLQFKFKIQTVFEHWRCPHVIVAESEIQAKYEYYRTFNRGFFEMEFPQFVKHIECENLGIADIE